MKKNKMSTGDYHRHIRQMIEQAAHDGVDRKQLLWTFADASTALVDALTGIPMLNTSSSVLKELYGLINDYPATTTPNPWFVWHKHDEGRSPETHAYLEKRGYTGVAATITAAGGGIGSLVTFVDIGSLAQNSTASASTLAHLKMFHDIAKRHRESITIQCWLEVIINMKHMKLAVRGGQLSATVLVTIPALSTAMSIIGSSVATGAKLGIQLKFTNVCRMTAMDLHWRAYQETVILEGQGADKAEDSGPARQILFELFARRGVTGFIWGKHNVEKLIKEPAGWMAIADKLLLI
ncbi:hypothetical protein J2125_001228 [Erwinia toletana]|uniref:Uncharacterized protein n=1 Tax=Winslowiella toletana TaxID=92490 RepID=A0ABS4P5W3_9GAMM|nr:hypothetical protein [Winslowiella toletana]MBP2168036.1 hypothetical protein [Winslowiella toletana]